MDLAPVYQSLLDSYLAAFDPLTGDERTGRTFRGTVQGILGAENLTCSRIAAFSRSAFDRQHQRRPAGAANG
jgi:hypothetical protein